VLVFGMQRIRGELLQALRMCRRASRRIHPGRSHADPMAAIDPRSAFRKAQERNVLRVPLPPGIESVMNGEIPPPAAAVATPAAAAASSPPLNRGTAASRRVESATPQLQVRSAATASQSFMVVLASFARKGQRGCIAGRRYWC
jgi:hypothetical protein